MISVTKIGLSSVLCVYFIVALFGFLSVGTNLMNAPDESNFLTAINSNLIGESLYVINYIKLVYYIFWLLYNFSLQSILALL